MNGAVSALLTSEQSTQPTARPHPACLTLVLSNAALSTLACIWPLCTCTGLPFASEIPAAGLLFYAAVASLLVTCGPSRAIAMLLSLAIGIHAGLLTFLVMQARMCFVCLLASLTCAAALGTALISGPPVPRARIFLLVPLAASATLAFMELKLRGAL